MSSRRFVTPGRAFARRRSGALLTGAAVLFSACTATTDAGPSAFDEPPFGADISAQSNAAGSSTEPSIPTTAPPAPTTSASPTTTIATTTSTIAPTTTSTIAPSTTATTTTTTTTVPPPLDVFDPDCVVRTAVPTSLDQVAAELATGLDTGVDTVGLWTENGFIDVTAAEGLVDICANNGINDIDGTPIDIHNDAAVANALAANVERQQTKLNELFAGFRTGDLTVDGVSGPRTAQRLCAARLALGFATTIADMAPGTDEQAALFAATALPTPATSATASERWVLIDRTCQIMFIGSDDETTYVFPTSTGSAGFETRDQDRADAFRFNPALDNGGWHNSSEFPVGVDNPLNGNLYKPLYFDLGQAIHGANNVPATPQSKGCARLRIGDQETLLSWLGLDDVEGELWRKSEMNVTVNVQGAFVPRQ